MTGYQVGDGPGAAAQDRLHRRAEAARGAVLRSPARGGALDPNSSVEKEWARESVDWMYVIVLQEQFPLSRDELIAALRVEWNWLPYRLLPDERATLPPAPARLSEDRVPSGGEPGGGGACICPPP